MIRALFAAAALSLVVSELAVAQTTEIRIAYLRQDEPKTAISLLNIPAANDGLAGATLAIDDNNTTGKFLNQHFTLEDTRLKDTDDPAAAVAAMAGRGISLVIADLPGLIPGAAHGKGLGIRFLRHTERTRLLVHLIDLDPSTGRDPLADYQAIQDELRAYSEELAARPQLVTVNKVELPGTEEARAAVERFCAERGLSFHAISAVTGAGLPELVREMARWLASEPWVPAAR